MTEIRNLLVKWDEIVLKEVSKDESILFVGFWTDKGNCDENTANLLKTIKDKKIFLFGTAGFGGSREYLDKIIANAQRCMDSSNTIIGSYMCQGKMQISVRQRYEKMISNTPYDVRIKKIITNFDNTTNHLIKMI